MVPEQPLYADAQVTVTSARFVVGSMLYPVRGLTAVQPIVIPPNRQPAHWCFALSACAFLLAYLARENHAVAGTFGLGGLCGIALGAALWTMAKPLYVVRVWTAGGQVDAVQSADAQRIQRIVLALHRAAMGG